MSGQLVSTESTVAPALERSALPELALGVRLLALAVVAATALVLPTGPLSRLGLAAGIVAGGLLGCVAYLRAYRAAPVPGVWLVLAQLALWTVLVGASGGERSPLFVGFLLEVPLSTLALGQRGALLAAGAGFAGYLAAPLLGHDAIRWPEVALVAAFLALAALICAALTRLWQRQQLALAESRAALAARAGSLSEELHLLGDYLTGALLLLDDMGRVVRINAPGLTLLGTTRDAALGRAWQEVLRVDAAGMAAIAETLAEGDARRGVSLLLRRPDGTALPLTAELWLTAGTEGRRVHLLLERARAEAAGLDPLQRLGEAVSCVAHQIKNSLHALQGYVREIEVGPGAPPARSETGYPYLVALQSLGDLADDILAMAGAARPAAERLALKPLLATAVLLARRSSGSVRVDVTGDSVCVLAPRGPLVHALFNLLDNACRVTRPGGAVRVRVAQSADEIRVEIEDGGAGVPAAVLAAHGRVASAEGSGLGLMAVRRFLDTCGGALTIACVPGAGTLCRVTLPAAPPGDAAPPVANAHERRALGSAGS